MRSALSKLLLRAAIASSKRSRFLASNPSIVFCSSCTRHHTVSAAEAEEESASATSPREGPEFSYRLNWAVAGRGVIVKDKVLHNMGTSELQKNGATRVERLYGIPLHVRGNAVERSSKISRAQFAKLLKQVTSHISSVSNVFVQDGAVASAAKCDAKVRIISDNPSAILSLSDILWETPSRAVSHDSCPLTVYIASNISPSITQALGLGTQASTGFAAADIERSSLILCGRAFADADAIRDALAALAAPVISARGGLPVAARLLEAGGSMILLFAPEETILTCSDLCQALVSQYAGVVLSSDGVAPFFRTRGSVQNLLKIPASVIIASADSTCAIPLVSKLSPGQAAYHFLAGYQEGKFVPAYSKSPSPLDPIALAMALFSHLKNNEIPSFFINVNNGGKHVTGREIITLASTTLSDELPENKTGVFDSNVRDLKGKYKSFLSNKFQELPEEWSF